MIIPTGRAGPVSGVLRTGDWPPSHVLAYTVCNTSTGLHRSAKLQTDRLEEKTIKDIMRRNEVLKEIVGTGYWVLSVHYLQINQNISISDYKGHREVSLRTFQ